MSKTIDTKLAPLLLEQELSVTAIRKVQGELQPAVLSLEGPREGVPTADPALQPAQVLPEPFLVGAPHHIFEVGGQPPGQQGPEPPCITGAGHFAQGIHQGAVPHGLLPGPAAACGDLTGWRKNQAAHVTRAETEGQEEMKAETTVHGGMYNTTSEMTI